MDHVTLKKKLSTYVSESGRLRNVSDELLCEVLNAWEEWAGTATEFYRSIGFTQKQMAKLIGKAKKLKREGHFGSESFKEIKVEGYEETQFGENAPSLGMLIELVDQERGNIIRFPQLGQLLEYLQKAS